MILTHEHPRRTKIVVTLGPSTDSPEILKRLVIEGMDVARINFSHGTHNNHINRIQMLRKCADEVGKAIGIIADLQGPKIRIASFKENQIHLSKNTVFILDATLGKQEGNENTVGIDYSNLPYDVKTGDELLLDDGRIILRVQTIEDKKIVCRVIQGGILSNQKGINRKGGGLSAPTFTKKDYEDMESAIALNCDYIAISFPRSPDDIHQARQTMQGLGGNAGLIAKVERAEILKHIDDIIIASEGIMVARGDLGVEIGEAKVPAVQKHIIQRARTLNKIVITATQMMESMVYSPIPTRAEVSDIANAVLDGTDAVMLSSETASGKHPDLVIRTMARICLQAEKHTVSRTSRHRVTSTFKHTQEAIAMAAMYIGNHFNIKAIIAFTETGETALWMSRIRSGIPIYGFTASKHTQYKITLYRGVYPLYLDFHKLGTEHIQNIAIKQLKANQYIQSGDHVLVTYGKIGAQGGTDTLKLLLVP